MGFDAQDDRGKGPAERVEVVIGFETMRRLQADLGPCLSTDGIFIQTDEPAPVDSEVGLRVMLPEEFVAFQAIGVVIWRREPASEDGPPGMAIRYTRVPGVSRATIDAIIDAHLASGGDLFDLDRTNAARDAYPTDALDSEAWRSLLALGEGPDLGDASERAENHPEEADPRGPAPADDDLAIPEILERLAKYSERQVIEPGPVEAAAEAEREHAPPFSEEEVRGDVRTPEPTEQRPPSAAEIEPAELVAPEADATRTRNGKGIRPLRWIAIAAVVVIGCVAAITLWRWGSGGEPGGRSGSVTPVAKTAPSRVTAETENPRGTPGDTVPTSVPEADAAAPTAPASPAAAVPATAVLAVSCEALDGGTRVVIEADRPLAEGAVDFVSLSDPPRLLIRLRGIEKEFTPYQIDVGSADLERVRIGFHPEQDPPELYLVLDLVDEGVELGRSEVDGHVVRVTVAQLSDSSTSR